MGENDGAQRAQAREHRRVGAGSERYYYDAVSNILELDHRTPGSPGTIWSRGYTYTSGTNRLASHSAPGGPVSFSHDAHGNMVAMPHLASIAYSPFDQMRHADLGGGGDAYFTYDASGKRVRKLVDTGANLIKERIYLGSCELYRERVSGSVDLERSTLHIHDGARRVAMVDTLLVDNGDPVGSPVDRVRYQLDNHLGSACLELDGAALVVSYEEYHPYGTTSYRAGPNGTEVSAKRYRYNGKERDEETGLYDYGARYYAAWLGRWTTADPLGVQAGLNAYLFCRAGPVNYVDPDGRDAQSVPTPRPAPGAEPIQPPPPRASPRRAPQPVKAQEPSRARHSDDGAPAPLPTSRARPDELARVVRQSLARINELGVATPGFDVLFDKAGAPTASFGILADSAGPSNAGTEVHGRRSLKGPHGKPLIELRQEHWDQLKSLADRGTSTAALGTYEYQRLGEAVGMLGHELGHHAYELSQGPLRATAARAAEAYRTTGLTARPMEATSGAYSIAVQDITDLANYTREALAEGVGVQLSWGFRARAALALGQPREQVRQAYSTQLTQRAVYGYVPARAKRGALEVPPARTNPLNPWAQRFVDSIVPRLSW